MWISYPDENQYPKPAGGWKWVATTWTAGFLSTNLAGPSLVMLKGGGTGLAATEPVFAEFLDRGIAVVYIDVSMPFSAINVISTSHPDGGAAYDGIGLVHKPGEVPVSEQGWGITNSDAWNNIDRLNGYKDFIHGVQRVVHGAATGEFELDPVNFGFVGNVGSTGGSNYGSANGTLISWAASAPDFADASKSDFRQRTSRPKVCALGNFQGYYHWYKQDSGNMGSDANLTTTTGSPNIGVTGATNTFTRSSGSWVTDGFQIGDKIRTSGFTNAANNGMFEIQSLTATTIVTVETTPVDETSASGRTLNGDGVGFLNIHPFPDNSGSDKVADTFDEVPPGYLEYFSPLWQIGHDAVARARNGANSVAWWVSARGFTNGGTTFGVDSAGTNVTFSADQGEDTGVSGKIPNLSGLLDPCYNDSTLRNVNRHSPHFHYAFIRRLRQIDSWHDTNSVLSVDQDTYDYASTAGWDTSLADSSLIYPETNFQLRIAALADFVQSRLNAA